MMDNIYVYTNRFSDKEKQLFWNLNKVSCRFINNLQPTNSNV